MNDIKGERIGIFFTEIVAESIFIDIWITKHSLTEDTTTLNVAVMSSHLITNRMRFYFFQSKCVAIVSSACHFPTRGGLQCKL